MTEDPFSSISDGYVQKPTTKDGEALVTENSAFSDKNLSYSVFYLSKMNKCLFRDTDLTFSYVGHSMFLRCTFDSVNMYQASLEEVMFLKCNMYHVQMDKCRATSLDFQGKMFKVNMDFSDLRWLSMSGQVTHCSFKWTDLSNSRWYWGARQCDFRGANFKGAILRGSFVDCVFCRADLMDADTEHAEFYTCDFTGAKNKGDLGSQTDP